VIGLLALVTTIGVSACTSDGGVESVGNDPSVSVTTVADEAFAETEESADAPADVADGAENTDDGDTASTSVPVDEILAELEANGFCDPADIEATGDIGTATAMHFVVDAEPAPPCHGVQDDRLDRAWSELSAVAPTELLDDISLLAGYEACEGCDTLAFVTSLDEAGSFFLMAIDVTAAQDDPDELSLTLMHELSHVYTQLPPTQLEVDVPASSCETYHNGNGCLTESSYLWDWISRFWPRDVIDTFVDGEADEEGGEQRCDLSPGFTGSYGASSPEEDFAEVFAAYVYDVDFDGDLDEKLEFFDKYDEFRQVRDRAADLGRSGLPNSFERCG
jgi:hypothetical protein